MNLEVVVSCLLFFNIRIRCYGDANKDEGGEEGSEEEGKRVIRGRREEDEVKRKEGEV